MMMAFIAIFGGLILSSCSKDDLSVGLKSIDNEVIIGTRMGSMPDRSWDCKHCGYTNPMWLCQCGYCGSDYEGTYTKAITSIAAQLPEIIKISQSRDALIKHLSEHDPDLPQIPPHIEFFSYPCEKWYETRIATKYLEDIQNTIFYRPNSDYAAGLEFAWYNIVRILYPGKSDILKVQNTWVRFLVGDGRQMRDDKGRGLKDGTQAAIDAFEAYMNSKH